MKRVALLTALVVASFGGAAPASTADGPAPKPAAKDKDKEKDKDKDKKAKKPASPAPRKVFTEDDLKRYSEDPEGKAAKTTDTEGVAAPADAPALPEDEEHGGRRMWSDRAEMARDRIFQAESSVSAIEARIAQLRTDRGVEGAMEPFRLQRIEADIAKAIEELEAAKKELATARAEQEKLFQQARQQGVPLGWLREP